jgi:hypothetical protein
MINIGTAWLNAISAYECYMKSVGLLSLVEHTTIVYKLTAIALERSLRTKPNTEHD